VTALLAGIIVSAYWAIAASRETDKVKAEQQRVLDEHRRALAAGALEITDPGVPHVRSVGLSVPRGAKLKTSRTFLWRVYLPRDGKYRLVASFLPEFNREPSPSDFMAFDFKGEQLGLELLVSLTLGKDDEGRWTIQPYVEGESAAATMLLPRDWTEPFDRKEASEIRELEKRQTYRLSAPDTRIELLRWGFSTDNSKTVLAGQAKFGGLQVWLERAGPDGTFAMDGPRR
jgi:hypothetical protein